VPQAYSAAFARAYQLRWGFFARNSAPLLRAYYESTSLGKSNQELLDLCCGTGVLAAHFLEHGYHVTGLDLSEAMLQFARQNTQAYVVAGLANFIQGDASDFHLDQKFGFIVSTFDALNHLADEDALGRCFRCVFSVLKEGGVFIFDLNTSLGLRQWNGMTVDDSSPEALVINRGFIVSETNRAWTAITGFLKEEDGRYTRFDEVAYNTIFDMERVRGLLLQAGFASVHFARLTDLAVPLQDPEVERRVFFVARKDQAALQP
jgi:SAM-dependent methyltransferase